MRISSTLLCIVLLFSFGLLEAQVPAYVPQSGLIGWWPFNGNAQDESGNGNHGAPMNNVKFIKDRFNDSSKAITLNEDSSYVKTSLDRISTNLYTISCWFKTSELFNNDIVLNGNGLIPKKSTPEKQELTVNN